MTKNVSPLPKNKTENVAQCLKITQIVTFQFLNVGIFRQFLSKLTGLVTLFDRNRKFLEMAELTILGHF